MNSHIFRKKNLICCLLQKAFSNFFFFNWIPAALNSPSFKSSNEHCVDFSLVTGSDSGQSNMFLPED